MEKEMDEMNIQRGGTSPAPKKKFGRREREKWRMTARSEFPSQ